MSGNIHLRPYQDRCIGALSEALREGLTRIILQAPVGAGKTVVAAKILELMRIPCVATAHRKELLDQMRSQIEKMDIPSAAVRSIQSIASSKEVFDVAVIVIDECHRTEAESYRSMIKRHPEAIIVGLTATPERLDGKSLMEKDGGTYQRIIQVTSVAELARQGYILLPEVFSSDAGVDVESIRTIGGDFSKDELDIRFNTHQIAGSIVEHYRKHANGSQAVLFAISRNHARSLTTKFNAEGISAECLFGSTGKEKREQIFKDFRNKKFQILVNVEICTEGWDYPELECVILACPTRSRVKYTQAVGRCMRAVPGKRTPIVLDHARCVAMHGLPEDEWEASQEARKVKTCPRCDRVMRAGQGRCDCGHQFSTRERERGSNKLKEIEELDENLVQIRRDERAQMLIWYRHRISLGMSDIKWWFGKTFLETFMTLAPPSQDPELRLIAQYIADSGINGCREWLGPIVRKQARLFGGDPTPVKKTIYQLTRDVKLSEFVIIRLICGNPRCVNPDHMEAVDVGIVTKQQLRDFA